jgi:hypothetical protein
MDMMRPIVLKVQEDLPAAPGNLIAVASLNPAKVTITWADPTPVDYVTRAGFGDTKGEIGFRIERAIGNGAFATIAKTTANSTAFTDTSVVSGGNYSYRAIAFNAAGNSSASNQAVVTVASVVKPSYVWTPATSSDGGIYATWGASTTPNVTYVAEEANNTSFTGAVEIYRGTALRTPLIGGHANGTWYVRVKGIKAGFIDSGWVVSAGDVVTLAKVKTPSYIWTPATSTDGGIYATWGASATTGVTYVLEQANNIAFTGSVEVYRGTALRSPAIPGHANGTWYMRVKAIASGYSDSPWVISTGCVVSVNVKAPSYIWTPATSANGDLYATWGASPTAGVTYVVEEANNIAFTNAVQVYSGTALRSPVTKGHTPGTWYMRVKATVVGYTDSPWVVSTGCIVN